MDKQEEKKITNEKPISLYGVDFKKLLAAFLQVKLDKEKSQDKQTKETKKA